MADIKPFKALRPKAEFISTISCLPYDVISRKEAADVIKRFPDSFLKVVKPESTISMHKSLSSMELAKIAARNLNDFIKRKILVEDQERCFYIYQQSNASFQRTGIVACLSVEDYKKGLIKPHEKIRMNTWQERVQHIRVTRAHTGCALVIYRSDSFIEEMTQKEMVIRNLIYDFISDDGIRNCCWRINQENIIVSLQNAFQNIDSLYIADGHHRVAAAVEAADIEVREQKGSKKLNNRYAYFPAVLIPHDQICILGYHRLLKGLNGFSPDVFLQRLRTIFKVKKISPNQTYFPTQRHEFGMNLDGEWYSLSIDNCEMLDNESLIGQLDVSILQNQVLDPLLGIRDPQRSERVDFIGGNVVLFQIENGIQQGARIIFTLYPVSVDDVIKISDQQEIMPPKSTWFEPKLRSGIFVHLF